MSALIIFVATCVAAFTLAPIASLIPPQRAFPNPITLIEVNKYTPNRASFIVGVRYLNPYFLISLFTSIALWKFVYASLILVTTDSPIFHTSAMLIMEVISSSPSPLTCPQFSTSGKNTSASTLAFVVVLNQLILMVFMLIAGDEAVVRSKSNVLLSIFALPETRSSMSLLVKLN